MQPSRKQIGCCGIASIGPSPIRECVHDACQVVRCRNEAHVRAPCRHATTAIRLVLSMRPRMRYTSLLPTRCSAAIAVPTAARATARGTQRASSLTRTTPGFPAQVQNLVFPTSGKGSDYGFEGCLRREDRMPDLLAAGCAEAAGSCQRRPDRVPLLPVALSARAARSQLAAHWSAGAHQAGWTKGYPGQQHGQPGRRLIPGAVTAAGILPSSRAGFRCRR